MLMHVSFLPIQFFCVFSLFCSLLRGHCPNLPVKLLLHLLFQCIDHSLRMLGGEGTVGIFLQNTDKLLLDVFPPQQSLQQRKFLPPAIFLDSQNQSQRMGTVMGLRKPSHAEIQIVKQEAPFPVGSDAAVVIGIGIPPVGLAVVIRPVYIRHEELCRTVAKKVIDV